MSDKTYANGLVLIGLTTNLELVFMLAFIITIVVIGLGGICLDYIFKDKNETN